MNYKLISSNSVTRYTFSGKERDEETGYSYFGARHYHPTLSIWLSVDPMADKYPSMSPYTYCGNNPVKLVDEDGREIGDYYNRYGKYLGTDGIDDGRIYFGESMSNYSVCTCNDDLFYALYNYNRTLKTPHSSTEYATVLQFGEIEHYMSSPSRGDHVSVEAKSTPDNPSGTFVHAHPINLTEGGYASPENLSEADKNSFKYFELNIVVGQTLPDSYSNRRASKCCFYNSDAKELGKISIWALKKVLSDQYNRHNMLINPITNID